MFENIPLFIAAAFTIGCIVIHVSERYATAVTAVLGFFLPMTLLYGSSLWAERGFEGPQDAAIAVQSEELGRN